MRNDPPSDPVVILGFGPAAMSAIDALRGAGYAGEIVVITDGEALPSSPVLTSYHAAGAIGRENCFLWHERDVEARDLTVVPHEAIAHLDAARRTITGGSGRTWRFSTCLIATGSTPSRQQRRPARRMRPANAAHHRRRRSIRHRARKRGRRARAGIGNLHGGAQSRRNLP